jgi:acyl carrier protein
MSQNRELSRAPEKSGRPIEQEAVRTTIVGGRPPGSGQKVGQIPRGIEVLVKKASVDPEFRQRLLEKRDAAAEEIGLGLDPAEVMMLRAAPRAQLEAIIDRTTVPQHQRRAFLGKAAAATLAALCAGQADEALAKFPPAAGGARIDVPPPDVRVTGIRPEPPVDRPGPPQPAQEQVSIFDQRIRAILSTETGVPVRKIAGNTRLVTDLHIDPETARRVRAAIFGQFGVRIRDDVAARIRTVDELVDAVIVRTRMGQAVVNALARYFRIPSQGITCSTALPQKLKADAKSRATLAASLSKQLGTAVPADVLANVDTVGDLIKLVAQPGAAGQGIAPAGAGQSLPVSRGIRPDVPYKGGTFGLRPDAPPRR